MSPAVTTFFACHKCDIVFETKEQRENHEAAVHPAASAKSFCCRLCDKRFVFSREVDDTCLSDLFMIG